VPFIGGFCAICVYVPFLSVRNKHMRVFLACIENIGGKDTGKMLAKEIHLLVDNDSVGFSGEMSPLCFQ